MGSRVLLIDDDKRLADMVGRYLSQAGFEFNHCFDASSGLAALALAAPVAGAAAAPAPETTPVRSAQAQRELPDLVLLDLMLPDADGLDVCRRIRELGGAAGEIPVLMLTARGETTDRVVGLEVGADDYLPKPFEPRELLARVRALLRRARLRDAAATGVASSAAAAAAEDEVLRFGRLEVDVAGRRVRIDGAGGRRPRDDRKGKGGPARQVRMWTFDVEMPDGRRLLARPQRVRPVPRPVSPILALGLLMLAGALVAWPVSRRITHRLERLQAGVDQQGAGNLAARVAVEGNDEVAALARSFNQSAARIEDLVDRQEGLLASQKRLLANASHELRSPLARIRMAIELMLTRPQDHEPLAVELRQNVAELDQLVDEILLASRLETSAPTAEEVDIAGLAAEEASRVDAEVAIVGGPEGDDAQAMLLTGDPRLLRRMLRNLLENAGRHGASDREPVRLDLARNPGGRGEAGILLAVLDRGPGVPPDAREKIFEPFYRVDGHSEQAGGVGLGLALVRQIAEAHGGSANCEAREGGGSRFVVWLPVQTRERSRGQPA